MSIMDITNKLGLMIGNSEELNQYRKDETDFLNDLELQKQMEEYKSLYNMYLDNNNEQLGNDIDKKYDALMKNDTFKNYMRSKSKFESLISRVHELIDFHAGYDKNSRCTSCNGCIKK